MDIWDDSTRGLGLRSVKAERSMLELVSLAWGALGPKQGVWGRCTIGKGIF